MYVIGLIIHTFYSFFLGGVIKSYQVAAKGQLISEKTF